MDPVTAFVIATAFMLLNGAVLGFVHPVLSDDLKPSASDWRIGTLLVAAGSVLLAANGATAIAWLIPAANGALIIGVALYLRSVRRYAHLPDTWLVFIPAVTSMVLNTLFTFAMPSLGGRLLVVSGSILIYLLLSVRVMLHLRRSEALVAANIMIGMLSLVSVLLVLRVIYYVLYVPDVQSITATGNMINALSPALIATMPVVGTSVFALLCFERMRNELYRVASTDALTKLANRRTIKMRATLLFAEAQRERLAFSIAVIDIDHFKQINDRLGHDAGDIVLCGVAKVLESNLRKPALVGRQGGEEFVALLAGVTEEEAQQVAERLREVVSRASHIVDDAAHNVTVSIGVASIGDLDQTFNDVLRRADRALYAAKAAGRDCVRSDRG